MKIERHLRKKQPQVQVEAETDSSNGKVVTEIKMELW